MNLMGHIRAWIDPRLSGLASALALSSALNTADIPEATASSLAAGAMLKHSEKGPSLSEINLPAAPFGQESIQALCPNSGARFIGSVNGLSLSIPDANPNGLTYSLQDNSGNPALSIGSVTVNLWLNHTYLGDLSILVGYDQFRDGNIEWRLVVNRPGANTPEEFGCAWDLSTTQPLSFSSSSTGNPLGVDAANQCVPSVNPISTECYSPSGVNSQMLDFTGKKQRGIWYVKLIDSAQLEQGSFGGLAIYVNDLATVTSTYTSAKKIEFSRRPNNARLGRSVLSFSVERPNTEIDIKIYDMAGRAIRTIPCGSLAPGNYHMPWDGRTDSGENVSAAVYFAKLLSRGQNTAVLSEKITILQ